MKYGAFLFTVACVCAGISCAAKGIMKDAPEPTVSHAYGERLTPVMRHPQLDRSYWGVAHAFHRSGSKRRNAGCNHGLTQDHPCPGADKGLRDPSIAPAASNAA